ncbi:MAG: DUF4339 domain-containing protein [Pseudomonadota bacterium]
MGNHRSSDAGLLETLSAEDETLRAGNRKSSGTNASEWLVNTADDTVVPMITSELVDALRAGRITNRSLVWRIGMHDWSPLAEVPQLRLAAGPSALPPAASTPGPVIHKSLLAPEQRRRTTLPFGLPAVRPVKADSGALAVYDRPAPSLSFADSLRTEWQGAARSDARARPPSPPVPAAPPVPPAPLSRPRLTPVPPVAARLPQRALRAVPSNTFAPTTTEAAPAAPAPLPNPWGDLSVVLASELRAEKKATKRLMLWAAIGSAVAASLFTLWVSRSVVSRRSAELGRGTHAALPAALPAPVESVNSAPSSAPVLSAPVAAPVASVPALTASAPSVAVKPRLVARPKPKAVALAASASSNPTPADDSADAKPTSTPALPSADATATRAPSSVAPVIQQTDPSASPAPSVL